MSASEQPTLGMFHPFPEQSPSTALFQALSSHEALEPATNIPAARLTYNQRQKQEKFYCQMCRDIAAEKPDIQTQDYMTNIKLDKDIETAVFVNARQYQRIMARRDRRCARERRGLVVKRPKLPLRATACDNQ
eukprot:TRINITY_DN12252_c0_g1_i10.p4 TRINITY_DN12252_c0_g1~~TRINITY_DN12252_c0_g1_i10.p4  ORF type:complete len:133 (+),score=22.43 TRINITY_DN12252_c0_g1_i10:151-549(+)